MLFVVLFAAVVMTPGGRAEPALRSQIPVSSCPVTLVGRTLLEPLERNELTRAVDDLMRFTALPLVDRRGRCSRVLAPPGGAFALRAIGRLPSQRFADYRARLAALVRPGDRLVRSRWRGPNGPFVTLGVTSPNGRLLKFDPLLSSEPGSALRRDQRESQFIRLTTNFVRRTRLRTVGYEAVQRIILLTRDARTVQDHTETISLKSGPTWSVAATKRASMLRLDGVACVKVVTTISYAVLPSWLEVGATRGGFSASVRVAGAGGSGDRDQKVRTFCANRRAFRDGQEIQ